MTNSSDSKLFYIHVGKNIKKYRDLRNYSLQALAEKIGLTKKTIQRYENGEIKIDMNRLSDIAEALEVSVSQLTQGAQSFLGMEMVEVPIYGEIRAGYNSLAREDIVGYEIMSKDSMQDGEYFYLIVKGDSMVEEGIHEGMRVLVKSQNNCEQGKIAVVIVDGEEGTLKRVYYEGDTVVLRASNRNVPPRILPINEVMIQGQVKKVEFDV
ncbi:helix-turn-helix domain-containing protein [Paenibacillus oenotherae]|uniref:Helix-turn-helix domain-containing protein n=1 Tax=Paenibacillus oenotherae TaxID=1435645 RepID=A0ABS7D9R8_9BACL|nr:S24 family peptidase [Paenibacillus oenotherae]MBW7475913.1 helix-turn-helix domain-containing protein [Paenibacillus oenotherae]